MVAAHIEKKVLVVMLVFFAVHALVISFTPLLPFIDLPNHLAEATIYKYLGDESNVLSNYYDRIPWYYPNTFHAIFCSLFPSVEAGNKVFHIFYILLLQSSLFLVIRKLNGNQWYGLLGLIFTYNFNLTFGFVGFAISIPVVLILFYAILVDFEADRAQSKIGIVILLLLLYFMHAQNALLGLLLYGIMVLYHYRKSLLKGILISTIVSLPLLLFIVFWWWNKGTTPEGSTGSYLANYYASEFWRTLFSRAGVVGFDNFSLYDGWVGIAVAALFSFSMVLPLLFFRNRIVKFRSFLATDNALYAAVLLIVSAGCYFLLPDKLPGQSPLYERFCTLVLLSFLIFTSVWLKDVHHNTLRYFSVIVISIYSLLWIEYIYSFNKQNEAFDRTLFSGIKPDAKLAGLIVEKKYRGRLVYIHFPNYHLVWNKGIVASKIIDYRFGIVRRVVAEDILPLYNEYVKFEDIPTYGYENLEYLLFHGEEESFPKYFRNFKKVKQAGLWAVYKNSHEGLVVGDIDNKSER